MKHELSQRKQHHQQHSRILEWAVCVLHSFALLCVKLNVKKARVPSLTCLSSFHSIGTQWREERMESHGGCKVRKGPKVAKFLDEEANGLTIRPWALGRSFRSFCFKLKPDGYPAPKPRSNWILKTEETEPWNPGRRGLKLPTGLGFTCMLGSRAQHPLAWTLQDPIPEYMPYFFSRRVNF